MRIEFEGSAGWAGAVIFDSARPDFKEDCPSIYLWVKASTKEMAEEALKYLVDMFASGRQCIFRARPEINYDHDFDTKEEWWQGFMRFSFVPGDDKWTDAEQIVKLPLSDLGAA